MSPLNYHHMPKKINIIIADDNLDDQSSIKTALIDAGLDFEISSVYNGLQLMDFLLMRDSYRNNENNIPDLILLDIAMPFMDGFRVLDELRKNSLLSKIPVYVISFLSGEKESSKVKELGA